MASSATNDASTDSRQSRFEQGVALSLNLWPALTLAVQNNWGGPDSADKRDWFAGQVVEQFPPFSTSNNNTNSTTTNGISQATQAQQQGDQEEPDAEYLEELILQVMLDEFEVNVDDDTAYDVAAEVVRLRGQCARGNFEEVDRLLTRWQARRGEKVHFKHGEDQDNETDWEDDDDENYGSDGGEDDDMDEAPPLVEAAPKKEKAPPEVDDDGFTKVTRKR
ncbi:hypothetical protein diail_5056 [Diaporthe ilicicola]|nr:hypothetical protein diail_5056 [Diaporthe ilicicola]